MLRKMMHRKKNAVIMSLVLVFLLAGCSSAVSTQEDTSETEEAVTEDTREQESGNERMQGGPGNGGQRGGMMDVENDSEIQTVLDENADKFEQASYTDPESGITLEYSLYVPQDYDPEKQYPLLMYIPDSTGAGKSPKEIVEQYYGATVWATEEDQSKHPSFVLVPAFSETVVDDNWNVSDQVDAAVRLIEKLEEDYSIDKSRIYTTGQSMGCMTSLYLNSKYPDLFAASLFVSGQWDISALKPLEGKKFFYITAGGDEKASGGQSEVMSMLDADGVAYSYDEWNAQDSADDQNAAVADMLSKGTDINMIRFEKGSVLNGGNGMEHMASFNYAYKLSNVRDWLFEQR